LSIGDTFISPMKLGSPKALGDNFGGQVISKKLRDDFLLDFIPFPFSLS